MSRYANDYGACEIDSLPGSAQVGVSHSVFIREEYRGKGIGDANHKLRLKRAKELHYDLLICTVRADNEKEQVNLHDNGWEYMTRFKSSNTGNWVQLWSRQLTPNNYME